MECLFYYNIKNKQKFFEKQQIANELFTQELTKSKIEIKNETLQLVSDEIHDNIGQMLTVLKLQTTTMSILNFESKKTDIINSTDDTIRELKKIQYILNQEIDNKQGIWDNLLNQLNKIKSIPGFIVNSNLDIQVFETMQTKVQIMLVRIINEFINNSLKHSRCTMLNVESIETNENLSILISDNGNGFEMDKIYEGNGLKNIKKRAELIQAKLLFSSTINKGTSLMLILTK